MNNSDILLRKYLFIKVFIMILLQGCMNVSYSPDYPDKYFNETLKNALTETSRSLLKDSTFCEIWLPRSDIARWPKPTSSDAQWVTPRDSIGACRMVDNIANILRETRLHRCDVDKEQGIVVFGYYDSTTREWSRYIYIATPLDETYPIKPLITKCDIIDWKEIFKIFDTNAMCSRAFAGDVKLARAYLLESLTESTIQQLINISEVVNIREEYKGDILRVLNDQVKWDSGLLEDCKLIVSDEVYLQVGQIKISNSFVVTQLVERLASRGVLSVVNSTGYLHIRDNLSASEKNEIEWAQVGVMNFIYGNLLTKPIYRYDKKLGDNWFFMQGMIR